MADNTVLNAGAGGDTIATDDVAGVKYQQVKLVDGTLDSAVPIPGGANGLRVDPSNVTSPTDPVDRAARDMGKVDVASLDQYTPQDVDTGAPVVNALPVVLKKAAAGAPDFGTSTDPIRVDPTGTTTQPVSAASLPLPTGAATEATLVTRLSESDFDTKIGSLTEVAPATDTASSGLNGRLQRIAQRITSLIVLLPAALVGGRLDVNIGAAPVDFSTVGKAAHDAGVSGNPVLLAGVSQNMDDTAPPNQVDAEADTVRLAVDRDGALFVRPFGPRIWSYHEDSSSALTDASVHAAPGAGLSLYVTDIVVSTGAATAFNIFFEEGASKVLGPYYLEATAGRGLVLHFRTPKKITANTALTVTTGAAIAHSIDITGIIAQG